ncbi:MAG: response regulator [Phototrophicaceae bacterium]
MLTRRNSFPMKGKCIFLVEDDLMNIELLRIYIEDAQANLEVNHSGKHVISDLQQCINKYGKIDLIILDLMLPTNSGFEICKEIRAVKIFNPIPIVAYSARHGEDVIEELKDAGFKGLIAKPFYGNFISKLKKVFNEDGFTYLKPSAFLN